MITNIIDKRTDKYNILCNVVYEPSWHDNDAALKNKGTVFPKDDTFTYDELKRTSIPAAIRYANEKWPAVPTTIYLYDWESLAFKPSSTEVTDGVFAYPSQPGGPFELPFVEDEPSGC